MRFGSVCSGIEAASVAWEPLGWKAAWFSEIEPFPSAVLAHHYPDVANLGDMTKLPEMIRSGAVEAPDLFCGGTPCQAFSVAGLRRSLEDARGNLSLTFCEIADAIDDVRSAGGKPASVVFWENVPGVLNTSDNAFGCFLGALSGTDSAIVPGGIGWTDAGVVAGPKRAVAWRVLDAQYFGLAQRRRRVFVVASAREGFDPAEVLLEWQGLRRDTAPSREAGKGTAHATAPCLTSSGRGVERTGDTRGQDPVVAVCSSLDASFGRLQGCSGQDANHGHSHLIAFGGNNQSGPIDVATACNAHGGAKGRLDFESETFVTQSVGVTLHGTNGTQSVATYTDLSSSLRARIPSGVENSTTTAVMQPVTYDLFNVTAPVNRQNRQPGDPCHTLARSNAEHAALVQPIAFHPTQDPISSAEVCHSIGANENATAAVLAPTLTASNDPSRSPQSSEVTAQQVAAVVQATAVAFKYTMGAKAHGIGYAEEQAPTLDTRPESNAVMQGMQVRRLTPVECERLQGFPDGYTEIPWRGKPAAECPDGPRYKGLGNSWAVPCVRWIGRRIQEQL